MSSVRHASIDTFHADVTVCRPSRTAPRLSSALAPRPEPHARTSRGCEGRAGMR